jgi:nucleoside-diphosphate-sugar epimerase
MAERDTVLLTGASGVIGRAVLSEAARRPAPPRPPLTVLVHSGNLPDDPRTRVLRGDVTRPRLGLDAASYRTLTRGVSTIVHSAARTDFTDDPADIARVNVVGTRNVLELARAADADLIYVSSAFVARSDSCQVLSDTGCSAGRDAYLASKRTAEALVRDSGVRAAIARPSLIMGNSDTGEISRQQGMHVILKAYCAGVVPFLPFAATAPIDFLPQDVIARALLALLDQGVNHGEYWLTSGTAAVQVNDVIEICRDAVTEAGGALEPPRFFPLETVQRLIIPSFIDCFGPPARRRVENLSALGSLFVDDTAFPSDLGRGPLTDVQVAPAQLRDVIRRTAVRYWVPRRLVRELAAVST